LRAGRRGSLRSLIAASRACRRLLQQVERAGDVGVNEVLSAMGGDMRLVQRGRMEDRLHAVHAAPHAGPVDDRADVGRVRRWRKVEAHDLVLRMFQGSDQRLAEMSGTARNQNTHGS
jgi:hypothetical protein